MGKVAVTIQGEHPAIEALLTQMCSALLCSLAFCKYLPHHIYIFKDCRHPAYCVCLSWIPLREVGNLDHSGRTYFLCRYITFSVIFFLLLFLNTVEGSNFKTPFCHKMYSHIDFHNIIWCVHMCICQSELIRILLFFQCIDFSKSRFL